MPVRSVGLSLLVLVAIGASAARAQTITTELDVTVGHSTEDVEAVASQLRIFGDAGAGWRYYAEGAWAQTWGPTSDAFGAAYPYDKPIRPIEVYAERTLQSTRYLAGVRVGQYRTPFGIYSRSDHAYNGFLRAPLIRYGSYWALSNNFLELGASAIAGKPTLFVEASLGKPQDQDAYARRPGLDKVVRVQGSRGPFIIGASHIRTQPPISLSFARGSTIFSGIDARWMSGGVQVRGEWIRGRSFDNTTTSGGYVDAIVHRPLMGPVTAVLRAERLDYVAGRFSSYPRRYTAGARIRFSTRLVGQVNVVRQDQSGLVPRVSALDLALTFTTRR